MSLAANSSAETPSEAAAGRRRSAWDVRRSRALRLVPLGAVCAAAMAGAYAAGEAARRASVPPPPVGAVAAPRAAAASVPASALASAPPLRGALADARDLECLTQAVYYEARGEPEGGQAAVAQVVLNRTRAGRYPASVCGVVFQHVRSPDRRGCQFSFACDPRTGRPRERAAWARAERVARAALAGRRASAVGGATQFRVAGLAAEGLQRVAQIGAHVFYNLGRGVRRARAAPLAAPPVAPTAAPPAAPPPPAPAAGAPPVAAAPSG